MCYAQVDGISNDTWEIGFFDKDKNYKLKTLSKLQDLDKGTVSGIVRQLGTGQNEITTYSGDKIFDDPAKRKATFNRHLILHGHSINYVTKDNAVRAIYLLDFLQFVIGKSK